MIRIFHDDVRPAPEGWALARTNSEAMRLLAIHKGLVTHISLDHDLGGDPADGPNVRGQGPETGHDLVLAMLAAGLVPPIVIVHSWNTPGGNRMIGSLFAGSDCNILRRPWEGAEAAWYR